MSDPITFKIIIGRCVFIAILIIVFWLFLWFSIPFFLSDLSFQFAGLLLCFVCVLFSFIFV